MTFNVNYILKKLVLPSLYKRYVENNAMIQQDIRNTLEVRQSKVRTQKLNRQFYHAMLYYPEFAFIFFWRISKKGNRWKGLFTKDFQCKIFKSSKIDGGLMCYHPFATVINAKSIGKNFQFRNGLTVGNKGNNNSLLPVIGDNVNVGANVVIIGDICIGNNVIIGAGSVVVKDIPSNVVVAGNPAMIIRKVTHG